jgi:hypothetical protein
MNRSKREAAKRSAENLKAQRANNKALSAQRVEEKEASVRKYIARSNQEQKGTYESRFLGAVAKKAPKLLQEKSYAEAVQTLEKLIQRRDVKDWKPKGKGRDSQFVSLAEHLLALYPMPKFLWSAFWEPDAEKLRGLVIRIAGGESFAKMCHKGDFPLALTKKQCHAFLKSTSDYSFMSALRKVQVQTYDGEPRLHQAWMMREIGRRLHNKADEAFWDSVISWFAKNPMLDLEQLGPLMDYIQHRRREDTNFSMKGRSVLAMLRGMEEWHGELQRVKEFKAHNYDSSGFKAERYDFKKRLKTGHVHETWTIEEILSSSELAAEGKAHKHCVYSYSHSIANGQVSIWSMKCNGERMITIEVLNRSKMIVQARGKYNRQTTAEEFRIIQRWASENGIEVRLSRW